MKTLRASNWADYELLQTGDGKRLERLGQYKIIRPDNSVLWPQPPAALPEWNQADAVFEHGEWERNQLPASWDIRWNEMVMRLKLTPFRHLGVFPEQAVNWEWIEEVVKSAVQRGVRPKVLNLFGYTGAASIVAAQAGAEVCHVDASKGSVYWASENARLSGLSEKAIRWIVDDVRKFVTREIKRGQKYDLILLDPPVFGRGSKGEVWRLEEDLPPLLAALSGILSKEPLGFLLNFYATELYPEGIARLVQASLPQFTTELAELCLEESESKMLLQTGYIVRS